MKKHAILSPSGASRWTVCLPSARFELQFKDRSSLYADEGDTAHHLAEHAIRYKLGLTNTLQYDTILQWVETVCKDNDFNYSEMVDTIDDYASRVVEKYYELYAADPATLIFLESGLDLTRWIPEGFGTGDVQIIGAGTLVVIDLKYGKGIAVSAVKNSQTRIYGLGGLESIEHLVPVTMVEIIIDQPRLDSVTTETISAARLYEWGEQFLKPIAARAWAPEGEPFVPGDHCRFCRAKNHCKALADHNLELAKYAFADAFLLNDNDIVDILSRAAVFINWINGIKEYALSEAIAGKVWVGLKLVRGRASRKYSDEQKVLRRLINKGFNRELIQETKLLPITKMEKAIGRKDFDRFLSSLITKPDGAPALVPESDPRKPIDKLTDAINYFTDEL